MFVFGDINLHLDNISASVSSRFLQILQDFDMVQLGKGLTHDAGHTIDVFITQNCFSAQVKVSMDLPVTSDHSSVCATAVFFDNSATTNLSSVRRDWSSFDIDSFKSALVSSKLVVEPPDTCDQFFMLYNSTLKTLLDDVVPLKQPTANRQRRRAPWHNAECRTNKAKT